MDLKIERTGELEELVRNQAAEIEELKRQLADQSGRVTRRGIVKGLGLGSLAALGAAGVALAGSETVQAAPPGIEASGDLAGELPARLSLKIAGDMVEGEGARDGSIEIVYFSHEIKSPRDSASGQATGRRQHSPIIFRKRIDKSTPLIAKALTNNEVIEGVFRFFRQTTGNKTEQFFTIEIKEGRVAGRQFYVPETFKSSSDTAVPPLEEVSFVYHTIKWVYADGGIEHEDTWSQRG